MFDQIALLKVMLMANHGNLGLQVAHLERRPAGLPQSVDTDLTACVEAVTIPFTQARQRRAEAQRELIEQTHNEVRQEGDGNCLFRSLLHARKENPEEHPKLRQFLVFYMSQNIDTYAGSIVERIRKDQLEDRIKDCEGANDCERYLSYMSRLGTWGGIPEIQAMSDAHNQPIAVVQIADHNQGMNVFLPTASRIQPTPPIAIINREGAHFNSLITQVAS